MRKVIALLLLIFFVPARPALSQECPLSNPVYKDLRTAALALEKRVHLPPGCEHIEEQLQDAGRRISDAAGTLAQLKDQQVEGEGEGEGEEGKEGEEDEAQEQGDEEAQQKLALAISGVFDVERLVSRYSRDSQCGDALRSASDYLIAFTETVNTLSPYLLFFAASQSDSDKPAFQILGMHPGTFVLGANLLGSAIRVFIALFNHAAYDMNDASQRQTFIENACGFYRLNENLRSIIHMQRGEKSTIQAEHERIESELAKIQAKDKDFPKPDVPERIVEIEKELRQDRKRLESIKQALDQLQKGGGKNEDFACYLVRKQVEASRERGEFPASSAERLEELLAEARTTGRSDQEDSREMGSRDAVEVLGRRYTLDYFHVVNRPELYAAQSGDRALVNQCSERAREWISVVEALLYWTEVELGRSGRLDLTESDAWKRRAEWEAVLARKRVEYEEVRRRLSFLEALAEDGSQIEMSELMDNRNSIRDALFSTQGGWFRKRKGPAAVWLEHKLTRADEAFEVFKNLYQTFSYRFGNTEFFGGLSESDEKAAACGLAENLLMNWFTAEEHVGASSLLCRTFENVIDEETTSDAARLCFGEFENDGRKKKESKLEKERRELERFRGFAESVEHWMQAVSCDLPEPLKQKEGQRFLP